MDPVSITGLVAATVQFADVAVRVLKSFNKLCLEIRNAPIEAHQFRQEVDFLYSIVQDSTFRLQTYPASIPVPQVNIIRQVITGSIDLLNDVMVKVTYLGAEAQVQGIRRLIWPFRKAEIELYITKIQRFKSTLSLALHTQQMYDC